MADEQTLGTPEAEAALAAQKAAAEALHAAKYTPYTVIREANIALLFCRRCGCALMLDEVVDVCKVHDEWHERIARHSHPTPRFA